MSNITLFSKGGNVIPAYLQTGEVDAVTKALSGSGGVPRISIRGGVWRMMQGNEEIAKNKDRVMNVVVVAAAPATSRTFYDGDYVEGENRPPACWSVDGVTPNAEVKNPQASKCQTCPQNIAGSGQGNSRACRYSRNLAVVLEGDMGGSVYKLNLPAQSIFGKPEGGKMPLEAYAKQLAAHRINVTAVVTEMEFDTDSATPKVVFKANRPLTQEEFAICREQGQTPAAEEAINHTFFVSEEQVNTKPAPAEAPWKPTKPAKPAKEVKEVKEAKSEEPEVRETSKPQAPPKSAAAVMAQWDDDEE